MEKGPLPFLNEKKKNDFRESAGEDEDGRRGDSQNRQRCYKKGSAMGRPLEDLRGDRRVQKKLSEKRKKIFRGEAGKIISRAPPFIAQKKERECPEKNPLEGQGVGQPFLSLM